MLLGTYFIDPLPEDGTLFLPSSFAAHFHGTKTVIVLPLPDMPNGFRIALPTEDTDGITPIYATYDEGKNAIDTSFFAPLNWFAEELLLIGVGIAFEMSTERAYRECQSPGTLSPDTIADLLGYLAF